jgi:hypothetical protein
MIAVLMAKASGFWIALLGGGSFFTTITGGFAGSFGSAPSMVTPVLKVIKL